jgi:hypothetical protein
VAGWERKELPVYVACCERASNSMRSFVNELGEREREREGASQKLERTAQGAGRTQRPPRSGLHMCVLKFQEDAGESQLLYSNWERRDFEREFGTRVEI